MQMLSRKEAARRMGVSDRTLDRLIKEGKIGHAKLNRRVLLSEDEVNRYLKRQMQVST